MYLTAIDFRYMRSQYDEIVVKELMILSSSNDQVSSYKFKKPDGLVEGPNLIRRSDIHEDHDGVWGNDDGNIPYSELKNVLLRETSLATRIYCFGEDKGNFISGLIDRPVSNIFLLGHSTLICMLCTYTCQDMFMHCSEI
jgi:hypothetical protein